MCVLRIESQDAGTVLVSMVSMQDVVGLAKNATVRQQFGTVDDALAGVDAFLRSFEQAATADDDQPPLPGHF